MENVVEILEMPYKISSVVLENFTSPEYFIVINIYRVLNRTDAYSIVFNEVSNLNISSSEYTYSDESAITIEDISSRQMENVTYKVAISEDVMSFYCKSVHLFND